MTDRIQWKTALLRQDMIAKGWNNVALAKKAKVSHKAVERWLSEAYQTPKMTKKLADALGFPVVRYLPTPHPTKAA